jgi:8-oxo-dGTP pyrophosphatase MutT (NUDIX family)
MTADPRITQLRARLDARHSEPTTADRSELPQAAVALVLRPAPHDLELLLIRRAERRDDPWSGHMALPGGRVEPRDTSLTATAMRETFEEVAIDLNMLSTYLGALPALIPRAPAAPQIVVHPFVFAVASDTCAQTSPEVALTLWVGLEELAHPDAVVEHELQMIGIEPLLFPAIDAQGHVVWGITYRVLLELLQIADPV